MIEFLEFVGKNPVLFIILAATAIHSVRNLIEWERERRKSK